MFIIRKKKADITKWAEAVYGRPLLHPELESEDRLAALTEMMILQDIRIIHDSVRLVKTSKNKETRDSRSLLAHQRYAHMEKLKPYARPVADKNLMELIRSTDKAMKYI